MYRVSTIINGSAVREAGKAWAYFLAVAAVLAALALGVGAACGGDGEDGDSGSRVSDNRTSPEDRQDEAEKEKENGDPSSRVSDSRTSPEDRQDEAEKENGDSGSRVSDNRTSPEDRQDEAEKENGDQSSSPTDRSSKTSPDLSLDNLASVPNAEYRWVVMLDVGAFLSADIPEEVAQVIGIYNPAIPPGEKLGIDEGDEDSHLLGELGISADKVDEATVLTVASEYGSNFALALRGDFDFGEISESLYQSRWFFEREFVGGELFQAGETGSGYVLYGGVALLEDEGYVLLGNPWVLEHVIGSLTPDASGSLTPEGEWPGEIGIATDALDVAVSLSADSTSPVDEFAIAAVAGEFDFDQMRKGLSENGLNKGSDSLWGFEVWATPNYGASVVLLENYGYVILGSDYTIEFNLEELLDLPDIETEYRVPEILQSDFGISISEVDALISLSSYEDFVDAVAIQGSFNTDGIRNSLDEDDRIEGDDIEIEAWRIESLFDNNAVGFAGDDVFLIDTPSEAEEFLGPLYAGDTLLNDSTNPLVRALEKVGTGWLVGAWDGSYYCEKVFDIEDDVTVVEDDSGRPQVTRIPSNYNGELSNCLATALTASNSDDDTIDVKWVFLFETEEAANSAARFLNDPDWEDLLQLYWHNFFKDDEGDLGILESKLETDGKFVELELSVTGEAAAEFLDKLISEMWGQN